VSVVELLVAGVVLMIAFVVVSMIAGLLTFVLWLVSLPFQLLGWLLRGVSGLLLLPVLLLVGGLVLVFGLMPVLPLVLAVWFVVWVLRRHPADRVA